MTPEQLPFRNCGQHETFQKTCTSCYETSLGYAFGRNGALRQEIGALTERCRVLEEKPLDMLLFCPQCSVQHVDMPQPEKNWTNPEHKTHECQRCGWLWRPSDRPTNSVLAIKTSGAHDNSPSPRYEKRIAELEAELKEVRKWDSRLKEGSQIEHDAAAEELKCLRTALENNSAMLAHIVRHGVVGEYSKEQLQILIGEAEDALKPASPSSVQEK